MVSPSAGGGSQPDWLGSSVDDPPNAIHERSLPDASWSSVNLAEAVPGVMSPLSWGLWGPASERGIRAPFFAMGALTRKKLAVPANDDDRVIKIFFGRQALRMDFICQLGDLIPGQTGVGLATDVFGFVPPGYRSRPSLRRVPFVAVRYPHTFATIAAEVRRLRIRTDAWWRAEIDRSTTLDLAAATAQLAEAAELFAAALATQATLVACAVQPIYQQVRKLAGSVGVDGGTLMKGHGSHEETAAIQDLWAVSRGLMSVPDFLAAHGYHGSAEGEVSSVVWREDPEPVRRLVEGYRALAEDTDPARAEVRRMAERAAAERELLCRLPATKRVLARLLLRLAARYLPLRGVAKVSYLQCIDVARASARRIGALLAERGTVADAEDVFYLTTDEVLRRLPVDPRALVAARRELRTRYQGLRVPSTFTGQPSATPLDPAVESAATGTVQVTGVGASPGVAEGRAVVVADPTDADIDSGDILIAHTTDPAWASVMYLSAGLVVDIGGVLSHAAVVAREIGVPCVMNTQVGTRAIATGDIVRMDGSAGTVQIISRAASRQAAASLIDPTTEDGQLLRRSDSSPAAADVLRPPH